MVVGRKWLLAGGEERERERKDIIANLIDFLLVPHATTDVLLAENEQSRQGHKRARVNMMYESNYWATPSTNSSKFKRVLQSSKGNKRARVNMMYATYTSSTDSSEISYSSSEATYDTDEEEEDDQNVTVSESEEEESTFESSKDNP